MRCPDSAVFPELSALEGPRTSVLDSVELAPLSVGQPTAGAWPRVRGYEILAVVGTGGMGIVYKARHRNLQRTVALKMLHATAAGDLELQHRLRAEAEVVAQLRHPHIIQIFEIGAAEPGAGDYCSRPFIALEFVDGGSLTQHTDLPQPPRFAAEMVEKLARAVHSAHRLGIVHRDLKPANVLLTPEGEPKIADFGVAKQLGTTRNGSDRFLTQDGTVLGTPEYMAPERGLGGASTSAVDIYALGVILYEMLTARVPFEAATAMETLNLVHGKEPEPPRHHQPGVPRDLETICLKCLEKEPRKRYITAEALADDLRRFLDHRPIVARRLTEFERLLRWCRRNPLVATLVTGIIGTFLAAFALVSRSYWTAESAWREEAHHRREAERKEKAERWERYRANIVAAAGALRVFNVETVRSLLADSPREHRNWEWQYYQSRLDLARRVVGGPDTELRVAQITANGGRALFMADDGSLRLGNTFDDQELRKIPFQSGQLTPDGKSLIIHLDEKTIELRDAETAAVHSILRGHEGVIHTLGFNADATRAVTAGYDGTIRVWELPGGRQVRMFRPYETGVTSTRVCPKARRIVTTDHGSSNPVLLDADTGAVIAQLAGHDFGVQGIDFSPSGDRVVTSEAFPGNKMMLWNATTGQLIATLGRHHNTVTRVAFSPDGTRIASSSMDQTVKLWDGVSGRLVATLKGHSGRALCVAFSPNSQQLLSGSFDHAVRLWDAVTGESVAELTGHTAPVFDVAFSPDGACIIAAARDGALRVWDARLVAQDGVLRGHTSFVYAVAFHPDGKRLVSAGWDGAVRIWDATSSVLLGTFKHSENAIITGIAVHPQGRLLATRARQLAEPSREFICLWDLEKGIELQRWTGRSPGWKDTRLAFSPDGVTLAFASGGGLVRLYDVGQWTEVAVLKGHNDEVRDLAFHPNGRWLASAGEVGDRTVRIWDMRTKEPVHVLTGHTDCVYALAFSPNGKLLASGSTDGTARLWDTATWDEVGELKQGAGVFCLTFTPDSSRVVCGCADNAIRLWDVATRQSVAELRGHTDYVHAVAFSLDGARMASASGDFTVRLWDALRPQDRARSRE